jgi:hypothetical protein
MAVVSYFLVARGIVNADPDTIGSITNIPVLIFNIGIFGALMYWFYRNRVKFSL